MSVLLVGAALVAITAFAVVLETAFPPGWWTRARVPIAHAPAGEVVRIVGRIAARRELLRAPLSGRPCVAWRLVIELFGSASWRPCASDDGSSDFEIVDDSGVALVETARFEASIEGDHRVETSSFEPATPELFALLEKHGLSGPDRFGVPRSYRFVEGVLEVGDTIAVFGRARWDRDPDARPSAGGGYREVQAPRLLMIEAPGDGPVRASDKARATR
jgi:hypothetical protein